MNYSIDWDGPGEREHDGAVSRQAMTRGELIASAKKIAGIVDKLGVRGINRKPNAKLNDTLIGIIRDYIALGNAHDRIAVGGNHLANILIKNLGGDFADRVPWFLSAQAALERIGAGDDYDVWCCWARIMRERSDREAQPHGIKP